MKVDDTDIFFCSECGDKLEVYVWPSENVPGMLFRKKECPKHGRKFDRIYSAAPAEFQEAAAAESGDYEEFKVTEVASNPSGPSIPYVTLCNYCNKRKAGRVYGNAEYGIICEDCHNSMHEETMTDSAIISHMNDIMAGGD
jgi:hypothetical protein